MKYETTIRLITPNKQHVHQIIEEILKLFPDIEMAAHIDPQQEMSEKVDIDSKKAALAAK